MEKFLFIFNKKQVDKTREHLLYLAKDVDLRPEVNTFILIAPFNSFKVKFHFFFFMKKRKKQFTYF